MTNDILITNDMLAAFVGYKVDYTNQQVMTVIVQPLSVIFLNLANIALWDREV